MKSSLPFNLVTNSLTCPPKHGTGQSELIKVLDISARESNPGLLVEEPMNYLSAMAGTDRGHTRVIKTIQ